ncbi:GPMI [Hepatospora eriocheir]|uniref:phosphoglycerate mutase (2,3-diphosphoglycerate-independent) n=2 Tax=Hepatospora eriocheir TaxID=1081669 RepID=A0A1X0Q8X2_9MICR|nr:GPMI [Hepatospora eriocheir]
MTYPEKKICLVIVDGFGIPVQSRPVDPTKKVVYLNELIKKYPNCTLDASGESVGLPKNTMGNSEMGHLTIGTGRINLVGIEMINNAIKTGDFHKRLKQLFPRFTKRIHLIGLLSDGCVHSCTNHCTELNNYIRKELPDHKVFIHAISDGRDTEPCEFKKFFKKYNNIVSVCGRFYAMDSSNNLDRTKAAYMMMTKGEVKEFDINKNYSNSITDEYFDPILLKQETIEPDDTIIFFNIKANGMIQLVEKFQKTHRNIFTMTEYKKELGVFIFPHQRIHHSLSEILSSKYISHIHLAESEKFPFVTYYFNGMTYHINYGEQHIMVQSMTGGKLDQKPACAMKDVARKTIKVLDNNVGFIVLNFAGPDLVGHTGNFIATENSVSILDDQIKMVHEACEKNGYLMIITADHGNCENMRSGRGTCTTHSKSKVPFIITSNDYEIDKSLKNKGLKNIAPTILYLMKIDKPAEMTGKSLVKKLNK